MKKTNTQKGITLIALIITIVVLLILAAVAISSITNDGILSYATNAAKEYNQAVANEQERLNEYLNFLNNGGSGSGSSEGTDEGNETYTAYSIGDTVTIGSEIFYVIEDSSKTEETVVLLAKENIDTTNLVQSSGSSASTIVFSSTAYWSSIEGITYPYDLVETGVPDSTHYAAYAAYHYGAKLGGTGRLMTYNEANALANAGETAMILGTDTTFGYLSYWLGSAYGSYDVWYVDGSYFTNGGYDGDYNVGVRPVVTISKSLVTEATE